jgi:NAD(P)-dependent dehydrogenase (short-subunit alcohol dehydrogenase family)
MRRSTLVTGATRGIGLAIASGLAELGHSVLLGSRDSNAGDAAASSLRRRGLDVTPVHLDLSVPASIDAAIKHVLGSGRAVDVLVNNAGVLNEKPLLDLADAEVAESVAVHLTGPTRLVATLPDDGPSGGFYRDREQVAW